ncbi:MAG: J domain-containing protein [Ramlibacter sp.]
MKRTRLLSHYDTLRVDRRATPQRIRLAYRRMAQKFHPDKYQGRGDAAGHMTLINQAYAVLSDPEQRQAYNASLERDGPRMNARRRGAALAASMQDRFGWAGWLLVAIASLTVITLGFVALKFMVPARPVFRAVPTAAPQATVAADQSPIAPVVPIRPWVEPERPGRPVNEATDPVARLVRDGVVTPQRRDDRPKTP